MKGPHSLGNKNENNIMTRYRGCHPSYIGNLDLLTCGNSDPGTSGILSPFCPMKSLYFDDGGEPDDVLFEFMEDVKNALQKQGKHEISVEFDTPEEYYAIINNLRHFAENEITVYASSKDDIALTFVQEEETVAEHDREDEIPDKDDGSLEIIDVGDD